MIYLIFWLLTALTGAAEEAPVPPGEVVVDECMPGADCTTTPSELPGPRPNG